MGWELASYRQLPFPRSIPSDQAPRERGVRRSPAN